MDERMNENNALPADVPAAETCAESAPQGARKYVKPAMKVFKLDCQMLAASGPVRVTVYGGISMYHLITADEEYHARPLPVGAGATCDTYTCFPHVPAISCSDFLNYFGGISFPKVVAISGNWFQYNCFGPNPAKVTGVYFSRDLGWSAAGFLAGVQLDGDCGFATHDGTPQSRVVTGSYNGTPVVVEFNLR
ncbi:MAG: hypothetical protein IJ722_06755 [Alloprevotella sp.]|nr:hypothetical protein [Alloprevotella sp.]